MKQTKVFIICGKARNGKDTTAEMIRNYYSDKKTINLQYSSYIKEYAKKISGWDGSEETKPRSFLQELGTEVIRKQMGFDFFVKRIIDDIKIYSNYFDVITISDARAKIEIEDVKKNIDNVYAIEVVRSNFDNGLSENEKKHFTEKDLDGYKGYDYTLLNDGTLDDLNKKVIELMDKIENE